MKELGQLNGCGNLKLSDFVLPTAHMAMHQD